MITDEQLLQIHEKIDMMKDLSLENQYERGQNLSSKMDYYHYGIEIGGIEVLKTIKTMLDKYQLINR